jgi:type VI secretion system protein
MPTSFDFKDLLRDSDDTINTSTDAIEEVDKGRRSGEVDKGRRSEEVDKGRRSEDVDKRRRAEDVDKGRRAEDVKLHTMRTETPENQLPDRELFDIFLESAGIMDRNFFSETEIPEIMRNTGAIFRKMVEGLMNILEGRSEQKKEIRADMTIVRRTANNPLKQLPAAEDVVKQLITSLHPGFLKGVDAVQEGCTDIMEHNLAMTAGLQVSLKKLLKQFDPQQFEEKHKDGISLIRKARCWDGYSQAYPQMVKELFDNIYGEAFVKTYDSQVRKLRKKLNE